MTATQHPVWCTRDHNKYTHHVTKIGVTQSTGVQLLQRPDAVQGFVQILDYDDPKPGALSIDTDELLAFARLMDKLGHSDIAELVRKAHATFAAGVAAAVSGPLDFEAAWRRSASAREADQ